MYAVTFASIEASLMATLITQPFWVIKTRMLLNTETGLSEIQHIRQKALEIYRQSGIKGFSKGLSLSLMLSFSGVLQIFIYEGAKIEYEALQIPETSFLSKSFLCGSFSKLIGVLITYPFTTVRTRIQQNQYFGNRKAAKYSSVLDITRRLIKEEGPTGFYKGLTANLMKGIPQKGIYFYFYELFKGLWNEDACRN